MLATKAKVRSVSSFDPHMPRIFLCKLLFAASRDPDPRLFDLSFDEFQSMRTLAESHHVIVRCMESLRGIVAATGDNNDRYEWAVDALEQERARIQLATSFLDEIVQVLAQESCAAIVIKSLDHWPDFGSDLDLYTDTPPQHVIGVMKKKFKAGLAKRSWGDRLANKWNFVVPGLPELVEIHVGRLGQTGELEEFAASLVSRARMVKIGNHEFRVPTPVHRLMICVLQRMYRHFYIRLCDIADTVDLVENQQFDFHDLEFQSRMSGIWEGVATFLAIVSDCAARWRDLGLDLPHSVWSAAKFGGDRIRFARGFLRIPILPQCARLYAMEWGNLIWKGQLRSATRLCLLPCLATLASVRQKITGSAKGIW